MRAGDARAEGTGCRFSHRGINAKSSPFDAQGEPKSSPLMSKGDLKRVKFRQWSSSQSRSGIVFPLNPAVTPPSINNSDPVM